MKILSGIKPTGSLTLGNYLGMIRPCVDLQKVDQPLYFIADLHALTILPNAEELRKDTFTTAALLLAAGVDPEQSTLFVQSHRPEHTQLGWILTCLSTMGELSRMTQYKEKQGAEERSTGAGLFVYPTLMAADILLYQAQGVPVGEDQTQHVELARDLAKRFNQRYGETFVVPELRVKKEAARIMGLDDPTKKMSKSTTSQYHAILLTDDAATIEKKIQKAVTDSGSEVVYADDKPALKNLLNIFAGMTNEKPQDIAARYAGRGYAEFKRDLAEVIIEHLKPLQKRYQELRQDESTLSMILRAGAEQVAPLAHETLTKVYDRVGLIK